MTTTTNGEPRSGAAPTASATARLDRIPVATRSHRRWAVLLGFLFSFDLIDLNTFAYVAPRLREQWGLSLDAVGVVTSIGFAGMFLGAILGGRLSDRFGRRKVLLGAVVFYSTFSLLSALSFNAWQMGVTRFLTGVGLQAMTGVLLVWVSEMYPRALRGRYQSWILVLGFVGVPVAAWVSRLVIPLSTESWRWVFVVGALGILGVFVAARILPESVRWHVAHGREDEALALVERLEKEAVARTGTELPPPLETAPVPRARLADLLTGRNRRRLIATSLVSIFLILCFYGFNSWLPTLLVENGYTQSESLNVTSWLAAAAVPGALLAMPFIDRFDRRMLLLAIESVVAVLLLAFGVVDGGAALVLTGFLATMLLQCGVAVQYTYIPEVFPTPLRGLGAGIATGFGRLAGVIGGVTVSWIYTAFGFTTVFVYLAVMALLMGLVLVVLGERTTNRALDDIGADDPPAAPGAATPKRSTQ
ncbi:MFS transporter [Streptomyces olivaceus]|uniref:MFS transporter n=1 Tax=Streptomyces TaxID=1883 RepID=UPI0014138D21|nr:MULTISPECIES: MFS transporter [Streptomyces]MBZ6192970.1 MFS transporter [Streptomyces olivaceus]MBZ6207651.1 MFS transporter [Streptomyces olivaceus]MBZ6285533.1 MFS transporter [Streptomyces olivaceus]MBZ6289108.1 MFS transporter [Streptomyces olivaceus]MBZ6303286.1 MFS transporter [Streptomyces olivaceus]